MSPCLGPMLWLSTGESTHLQSDDHTIIIAHNPTPPIESAEEAEALRQFIALDQ